MRDKLERLVEEMVERGVHYPDACRAFERRFISHVLLRSKGNLGQTAERLGIHRNTLSRKITEHRIKPKAGG